MPKSEKHIMQNLRHELSIREHFVLQKNTLLENTRYANGYQCLLTGWIYQYLFTGYTNMFFPIIFLQPLHSLLTEHC